MAAVPYLLDEWSEDTHRLLFDATLGKECHHLRQITAYLLHFVAFRIEHTVVAISGFCEILAITIVGNWLVGKACHHLTDDFPLVPAGLVEAVKILTNQRHHIAALRPVTTKIGL